MVPSLWSWSVKSTGRWTNPWSSTLPPRKNTSRYMMSHKRRLTLHSRNFVTCTHKHIHTHVYKHSNTNKKRGVCVWRWLGQGSKKQTLKRLLYKVKKNKPTTNKCVLYTLYLFVFTPSFSVEGSRAEQCCSWQVNHILYDGLLVTVTVDPLDSVHSLSENTLYHYGGGLF